MFITYNDNLNKTLMETRVLVNSLDNEVEKLKLENNRLKEQIYKLTIIKEKYEPSPDMKIIKHIETQTQSDLNKKESYFNIFSYFKK
jgi:regulator of replication initiation timing